MSRHRICISIFFQPFKKGKNILSSQATQKLGPWVVCRTLEESQEKGRAREERRPPLTPRCVVSSYVPHYELQGHEPTKRPGPGLGEWGFTETEGTRRSHAEALTRAMTPEMNTVGLGGLQGKERQVRGRRKQDSKLFLCAIASQ